MQSNTYIPLKYSSKSNDIKYVRKIGAYLLNKHTNNNWPIKKWKKLPPFELMWQDNNNQEVKTPRFTFNQFTDYMISKRTIDPNDFSNINILCPWLDSVTVVGASFHVYDQQKDESIIFETPSSISKDFPLVPKVDREGIAFGSMQLTLQQSFIDIRNELVSGSNELFKGEGKWLRNLFLYFNIGVSLVEMTLIQMYYRAKYENRAVGWSFDEEILGSTMNRNMEHKIKWIGQITGKPLNDARDEISDFNVFKSIRNHLNHFDPPIMAYTIEDIARWLNYSKSIAILLWKIRDKLNANISLPILEMLLAPEIDYVPNNVMQNRKIEDSTMGYQSCIWTNRQNK